jgi:hypothetical protein
MADRSWRFGGSVRFSKVRYLRKTDAVRHLGCNRGEQQLFLLRLQSASPAKSQNLSTLQSPLPAQTCC